MSGKKFSDERFQLTDEKAELALEVLRQRLNRQLEASLEVCVRCGICGDSCHYYVPIPNQSTFQPIAQNNCVRFIEGSLIRWPR